MKRYAYLFTLGGQIQWSGETEENLPSRGDTAADKAEIKEFMGLAKPGHFMRLSTGEMIFCIE